MAIKVRLADIKDMDQIMEVEEACFLEGDRYSRSKIAERITGKNYREIEEEREHWPKIQPFTHTTYMNTGTPGTYNSYAQDWEMLDMMAQYGFTEENFWTEAKQIEKEEKAEPRNQQEIPFKEEKAVQVEWDLTEDLKQPIPEDIHNIPETENSDDYIARVFGQSNVVKKTNTHSLYKVGQEDKKPVASSSGYIQRPNTTSNHQLTIADAKTQQKKKNRIRKTLDVIANFLSLKSEDTNSSKRRTPFYQPKPSYPYGSHERKYFVAEENGELLGYGEIAIQGYGMTLVSGIEKVKKKTGSLNDKVGSIVSIAVKPGQQGKGIGSKILKQGFEYLQSNGIKEVFAHAWPNGGFPYLGPKNGFEKIDEWRGHKFSDGTEQELYFKRFEE